MKNWRSFKYRIYPNIKQKAIIDLHLEANRVLYNYLIEKNEAKFKEVGTFIDFTDKLEIIAVFIKDYPEYKDCDITAFKNTIKNLEALYGDFKGGKIKRPKIKDKSNNHYSYKMKNYNCNCYVSVDGKKLSFSRVKNIRTRNKNQIDGTILSVTVHRYPNNDYYAVYLCKDSKWKPLPKTAKSIGIDMGVDDFAIMSDGTRIRNENFYKMNLQKLEKANKKLARMVPGSKRFEKQRIKVANIYQQNSNRKDDFINKLTKQLVTDFDEIYVETLGVQDLIESRKAANQIREASWSKFHDTLKYKAENYEKKFKKIGRYVKSSQMCSNCGFVYKEANNPHIKIWICPNCKVTHDRDINAAKNILKVGKNDL